LLTIGGQVKGESMVTNPRRLLRIPWQQWQAHQPLLSCLLQLTFAFESFSLGSNALQLARMHQGVAVFAFGGARWQLA
jgi:hypothetical protein